MAQLAARHRSGSRGRATRSPAPGSCSRYLWLPYMILPLYAGLDGSRARCSRRLPTSAPSRATFFKVVLPLVFPALVAGSIFTFSLTLGDYITPEVVSSTQFIGNVIYDNVGVANNLPLAAAYAFVPISVMVVYLMLARRAGAFENLYGRRPSRPVAAPPRHGPRARVHLLPARRDRALRFQRRRHAGVADPELDDEVVHGCIPRPGCARCVLPVCQGGDARDADRARARHAASRS